MSSAITALSLLATFASTVLAAPWNIPQGHGYRGHSHYPHSRYHGTGTGNPTGTGIPYPAGNGTGPYGSGTGTGTAASTGFYYTTGFVTVTDIVTVGGSATDVAAAAASTSSSCDTPIVSTTETHIVIVTVTPSAGYDASATNAFWSVPSISTPAGYPVASSTPVAPVVTSSTSVAPVSKAHSSSIEAAGFSYGDFSYPWKHHSKSKSEAISSPSPVPVPTPSTSSIPVAPIPTPSTSSISVAPIPTPSTSSTPVAPVETSTTPVTSAAPTTSSVPVISIPLSIPVSVSIPAVSIPSVVAPSSTSAAPKPSATYGGTTTGSKRGLPYNDASLTNCFAGSKISWAYNWASSSSGLNTDSFEYVPQLWGTGEDFVSGWVDAAKSAISGGAKHILGFNEPDLAAQSNLSPAAAATAYMTYITSEFAGSGVQLGSPAVTNGGGDMGLTWLSSFLNLCADCKIDFVAVHWYDSFSNVEYFKSHVTDAHQQTGLPVWVTEFGTTDGDDDQIAGFLQEVMPWLDSQDFVQRYAYFMAKDGLLNSGSEMSQYGETYATYENA